MTPQSQNAFAVYLKAALAQALHDEATGADNGNLNWIHTLARRGVRTNWSNLTAEAFLEQCLWCVGSIQKDYAAHERNFPSQVALFRQCNPDEIARQANQIREDWAKSKCYLSGSMVDAVLHTAMLIAAGWEAFKRQYLLLPRNPEAETAAAWADGHRALQRLKMVGPAIAWYLIRNLYGAPFFKPDVHINAIVNHFFGPGQLQTLEGAVRRLWPTICADRRFSRVHLGEVDYFLWWYRQATGEPRCS
jgi:hypothetical protein